MHDLNDLSVHLPATNIDTEVPSLQLFSAIEQDVIRLALESLPVDTIGLRLALPKSVVLSILAKPDIQEHLKLLSESLNQMETMRLKALCERMIDERIAEAEEAETSLTKKDILEVLKVYNDILSSERKAMRPKAEDNIYVSILNQVMDK